MVARAVRLAGDTRPILTDECLAPQIRERDATIRGLQRRLLHETDELRRAEWLVEKLRSISEETKSPFAACPDTMASADLPRAVGGVSVLPPEHGHVLSLRTGSGGDSVFIDTSESGAWNEMPEPKVISIQSGVRTEQLLKFVKISDLRKRPRAAQLVHDELLKRKAA
jgi:hypothetical protein